MKIFVAILNYKNLLDEWLTLMTDIGKKTNIFIESSKKHIMMENNEQNISLLEHLNQLTANNPSLSRHLFGRLQKLSVESQNHYIQHNRICYIPRWVRHQMWTIKTTLNNRSKY